MIEFFTNADQFGALSQVSFFNGGTYKTIYGGILSLLIYSLGFSYFVYLMIMWQTDQIPPTITYEQKFDKTSSFTLSRPLYIFSLEVDESNDKIYQLQQKGQIFQYQIGKINDVGVNLTKNPLGFQCGQSTRNLYDYYDPVCINLEDQKQTVLFQNYMNRTQDSYLNVSIDYCDPKVFNNCLSLEDQSSIYNQSPSWRLTLITQDIDLQTGYITDIPQDYYFGSASLQNMSTISISLRIRKGTYKIDTGILFPKIRVIEFVKSIELVNQITQYTDKTNDNVPMIAYIEYHLDRNEEIITVTYPKLGQVLAQLGSILQVLLLLGMIMYQFNDTQMQLKIEKILLDIYFPEIKLYKFNYNWKGQIQTISQMGVDINPIDFERMKIFINTTGKLLRSKLNSLNMLHEISRLQIQSQSKISRSESLQQQSLGYKLNLPKLGEKLIIENENERILDQRDFQILCHDKPDDEEDFVSNLAKTHKVEQILNDSLGSDEKPQIEQKQSQNILELTSPAQKQLLQSQRNAPKAKIFLKSFCLPNLAQTDQKKIYKSDADQDLQICNNDYEIPKERNINNILVVGFERETLKNNHTPTTNINNPEA